MKIQLYSNQAAEVYVFDSFAGFAEICDRLSDTGLFVKVYRICDSGYMKPGSSIKTVLSSSQFKKILIRKCYDQIFVYNIYGAFIDLVFNVLKKRHPSMIFNMVEDGPSLYYIEKRITKSQKFLYPVFRLKVPVNHIDFWWFSIPERMQPFDNGKKKKMPTVDKTNSRLVDTINFVFQYQDASVLNGADIIIMEECYWSDGLLKSGADYELFRKIKDTFSESKVIVKLHPRTRENRFQCNFEVLPSNGIPWEVYALNVDMGSKILVSLSCTTMISSKLLFNEETYSLLLYPIVENEIIEVEIGRPYLRPERKKIIDGQCELYENKNKFQKAETLEASCWILRGWIDGRAHSVE